MSIPSILHAIHQMCCGVQMLKQKKKPSDVQIVLAVPINGVPFGGDKQV